MEIITYLKYYTQNIFNNCNNNIDINDNNYININNNNIYINDNIY